LAKEKDNGIIKWLKNGTSHTKTKAKFKEKTSP